jgi:histone acetyltransferase HTATIP
LLRTRYGHEVTASYYDTNKSQYNLEGIKRKVADAIIDRMPFLHNPLSIVDLAACIYGEQCPQSDNGLRASAVTHVQARMPSILQDADAWTEYVNNKELLYAYHQLQCESLPGAKRPAMPSTPPTTPTSADKRKRTRT